ncbi:MAG: hypothetical protein QGG73_12515, partial [Candidatus Hydrogenedentes bacterium]|nr:hypothetical protein [Candidatus Hydrogenedentota bacterium]
EHNTRVLEMMVIMVAAIFAIMGSHAGHNSGETANSRLATVLALTEHGTWYIDRPAGGEPNYFEQRTIDKVVFEKPVEVDAEEGGKPRVERRTLSSKPPILPLLMTAEYVALNRLLGLDLLVVGDRDVIVRWMSLTLIACAFILTLIFFSRTLRLFIDDPMARIVCLCALAFCTQLWGYSTNMNDHVPGACMLTVCLYFALGLGSGKLDPAPWRFLAFGITGGLVATLDMPGGIFVLIAGVYLIRRFPKLNTFWIWTSVGALLPLGAHFAIMVATTGGISPVQMNKELYLYEASYWRNPRGIDALNEPLLTYLFHMTFGRFGQFSLYPITFAGIIALAMAGLKENTPYRDQILAGGAGFLILTLYYAICTDNYGGEAYGFRWYIVATPPLLLMAAPLLQQIRERWVWIAVALVMGVSFFSAWECADMPWGPKNAAWTCRMIFGPAYSF